MCVLAGSSIIQGVVKQSWFAVTCRHHAQQLPQQPASNVAVQCSYHCTQQWKQVRQSLLARREEGCLLGGMFLTNYPKYSATAIKEWGVILLQTKPDFLRMDI